MSDGTIGVRRLPTGIDPAHCHVWRANRANAFTSIAQSKGLLAVVCGTSWTSWPTAVRPYVLPTITHYQAGTDQNDWWSIAAILSALFLIATLFLIENGLLELRSVGGYGLPWILEACLLRPKHSVACAVTITFSMTASRTHRTNMLTLLQDSPISRAQDMDGWQLWRCHPACTAESGDAPRAPRGQLPNKRADRLKHADMLQSRYGTYQPSSGGRSGRNAVRVQRCCSERLRARKDTASALLSSPYSVGWQYEQKLDGKRISSGRHLELLENTQVPTLLIKADGRWLCCKCWPVERACMWRIERVRFWTSGLRAGYMWSWRRCKRKERATRVCVVDNDGVTRHLLSTLLCLEGYEVVTARDSCKTVDFLTATCEHWFVLMDIMMPCLSGLEARH